MEVPELRALLHTDIYRRSVLNTSRQPESEKGEVYEGSVGEEREEIDALVEVLRVDHRRANPLRDLQYTQTHTRTHSCEPNAAAIAQAALLTILNRSAIA
jgi:hypothetical protein